MSRLDITMHYTHSGLAEQTVMWLVEVVETPGRVFDVLEQFGLSNSWLAKFAYAPQLILKSRVR
jgi:hypothetical protein